MVVIIGVDVGKIGGHVGIIEADVGKIRVHVGIIDVHVGIFGVDVVKIDVHVVISIFWNVQKLQREKRSGEIHTNNQFVWISAQARRKRSCFKAY